MIFEGLQFTETLWMFFRENSSFWHYIVNLSLMQTKLLRICCTVTTTEVNVSEVVVISVDLEGYKTWPKSRELFFLFFCVSRTSNVLTSRTETRLRIQSAEGQQGRRGTKFNAVCLRHANLSLSAAPLKRARQTDCAVWRRWQFCNGHRQGSLKKMIVLHRNWSLWFTADDNSPSELVNALLRRYQL
jgi:hypothetical protein